MELEHFSKKGSVHSVSDPTISYQSFWCLIIFRNEVNSKNAQNHQKVIFKRFQFNEKLYYFFFILRYIVFLTSCLCVEHFSRFAQILQKLGGKT